MVRREYVKTEEFLHKVERFKEDLLTEVIPFFRKGDKNRGDLSFERWRARFKKFLQEYTPSEASRFLTIQRVRIIASPSEHPFHQFMRESGNKCIAFLDELYDAVIKGYVELAVLDRKVDLARKELGKDSKTLRDVLGSRFSDEEIGVLCYDYFREVYKNFSENTTKANKIQTLIEYVENRSQAELLWEIIYQERPDIL